MKTSMVRDELGYFSPKNIAGKYWGVSPAKNKKGFTVRFQLNGETINFKPVNELSLTICAVIATKFYEDRELYSTSTEFSVPFGHGDALVNTCKNTIEFKDHDQAVKVTEPEPVKKVVKKAKKAKVMTRVDEIIAEALYNAKRKLGYI